MTIGAVFSPFLDGLERARAAQSRLGPRWRVYGGEGAREAQSCNSGLALLCLRLTEPMGQAVAPGVAQLTLGCSVVPPPLVDAEPLPPAFELLRSY